MNRELWTASCILMILGLAAAAAGIILGWIEKQRHRPYSALAEARVVEILHVKRERPALSEFRNRQSAVFEFFAGERLMKVTDDTDVYPCPYYLHQRVRIRYNPENPEEYYVAGREPRELLAILLQCGGILLLFIGFVLFFLYASRYDLQ